MPILTWTEEYSVGVERIDTEHKKLLDMVNKAYDSAELGEDDQATLAALIADMIDYASYHFETEANLMKEHGFPESSQHILAHGDFTARAVVSGNMPSQEWALDPITLFRFLADWFTNHVLKTDKELGQFLNAKGIR